MLKSDLIEIIKKNILVKKETKDNFYFINNDWEWIFDFRRWFLVWDILEKFCLYFWDKYENEYPFQIWCLELWAVPFLSWLVYEWKKRWYNVNSFIVRKQRKTSWLWNQIEWILDKEKIFIIDDLVNSGDSLFFVSDILKYQENREVYKFFVFVNFWREKLNTYFRDSKKLLEYEFTLSDFWLGDFYDFQNEINHPLIFPPYKLLYSLSNPNRFLDVPKSNLLKIGKNLYFWWEWWKLVSICSDTWNFNFMYNINPVKWHKNILSSPIHFDNKIFFWWYDWNLHCIDAISWNLIWIYPYAEWIWSSPCFSEKDRSVFIWLEHWWKNNKWSLISVDLDSWELNWQIFFNDYVHSSPEYSIKYWLVVCWCNDWKIICVRSDNWNVLYERFFDYPIKWGFFISDDWKIYFWCFDRKLYCLDLLYWKILYSFQTEDIVYSNPYIIDNNIFFWSFDKHFYHLDINLKLISKVETYWKIYSQPTYIWKDLLVFWSNDSFIYFYNFKINKIIYVIRHIERISTKIIYDEEFKCIYVYDFLNNVYKYDLKFI